jgi:hypothetical protein
MIESVNWGAVVERLRVAPIHVWYNHQMWKITVTQVDPPPPEPEQLELFDHV